MKPTKYRKRAVEVEAFQYDGDMMNSSGDYYVPDWAVNAINSGSMYYKDAGELHLKTLEGDMKVSIDDYVIQGVQGELYPCKPAIFWQTYDAVIAEPSL